MQSIISYVIIPFLNNYNEIVTLIQIFKIKNTENMKVNLVNIAIPCHLRLLPFRINKLEFSYNDTIKNWTLINDDTLKYLKGIHTLYLKYDRITNNGLVHLKGIHTLKFH